jgi:3-oxoacyl-(acyl-carrier-protein) synthase
MEPRETVTINGAGWVTPLGTGIREVWEAVRAGVAAPVRELPAPAGSHPHSAAVVPPALVAALARNPRLRRSSNISLFAAAAALAALADAGIDPAAPGRLAIIFSVTDGGVIYTRRFYDQVVREGSGSPLLFPETVYNAPASHVAALLGIDGITYTLVGDAAAGLSALALGVELLNSGQADRCLVVGAEEADWVLGEAYRHWRLSAADNRAGRGALIADGAAAVVLGRGGEFELGKVTSGVPFLRQSEAGSSLLTALKQLPREPEPTLVVAGANGTFADHAEAAALKQHLAKTPVIYPKHSLGDAFGASALMQIICALQSLRDGEPGPVLTPVVGLNHEAAAALVGRAG